MEPQPYLMLEHDKWEELTIQRYKDRSYTRGLQQLPSKGRTVFLGKDNLFNASLTYRFLLNWLHHCINVNYCIQNVVLIAHKKIISNSSHQNQKGKATSEKCQCKILLYLWMKMVCCQRKRDQMHVTKRRVVTPKPKP